MSEPTGQAATLLLGEAAELLPILQSRAPQDFELATVLPGWTVRDVLAHCSAALHAASSGVLHGFTAQDNQRDVDERRPWPLEKLLAELADGYTGAARAIDAAGGKLDALALGEWVHGGDVRDALGLPGAYASTGIDDALDLLAARTRSRPVPRTEVRLVPDHHAGLARADAAPVRALGLGPDDGPVTAWLETDPATLIRLAAGRAPDPSRYTLRGAEPEQLLVFS